MTLRRAGLATASAAVLALSLAACSPSERAADSGSASTSASASVAASSSASATASSAASSAKDTAVEASQNLPQGFDLQSHRGGRGEITEESAAAFQRSLDLGVTTLEFDIVVAADGTPVVWHDPTIQEDKCADTQPAEENDPAFPYVGKLVHELTWPQLQTLDCGKQLEKFPDAQVVQGNQLIQLEDVFELARGHDNVHFNIETKIEAEKPEESASPQEFVDAILPVIDTYDVAKRVMIQSFDWRSLPLVRQTHPQIPLVMLWDETTWKEDSAWTGGIDYTAVDGDIIEAAKQLGVEVLSPGHAVPYGAKPSDSNYHPVATPEFLKRAHDAGFAVVPWTVNDPETIAEQIEAGVDGLITDYPTRALAVLEKVTPAKPFTPTNGS